MDVIFRVISYAGWFLLGRYSYLIFKNVELERKRKTLLVMKEDLIFIATQLEEKDARIRKKWQSMIDDFATTNSYVLKQTGKYKEGEWTDWDDQYLSSWGSAEQ